MTIEELARYCEAKDVDKFGEVMQFTANFYIKLGPNLILDKYNTMFKDYTRVTNKN